MSRTSRTPTRPSGGVEDELKLAAPGPFALPDLTAGDGLPGVGSVSSAGRRTLRATYWDTEDLRLARNGVTLRHRTGEPGAPWQLKLPATGSGPGTSRLELAEPGPAGRVPDGLRALLTGWVRTAELVPVATLRTERDVHLVLGPDGSQLAELVDDAVSVLQGRRVLSRFRELEVERRGGPDELLAALQDALVAAGAVPGAFTPKVVRALGPLATTPSDLPEPPDLDRAASAGAVVAYSLAVGVRRLVGQHARVLRGEPDGVHQMRVACRRLRSDLRTFRPLVDREWADGLRAELKWLADSLGAARDLEVLRARIADEAGDDPLAPLDQAAVSRVDGALADRERTAESDVEAALGTARYAELLDRMVAAARRPVLTAAAGEPAGSALPPLVGRAWRQLAKAARRLHPDGPDDEWHEVRILAKRARYASEAVSPALGKRATRLAAAAASVQQVLGEHQDAVIVADTVADVAADHPGDVPLVLVCGRLVERERAAVRAARAEFPAAWQKASAPRTTAWLR